MSPEARSEPSFRQFRDDFESLRREVRRVIVGQEEAIDTILVALAAGGHVLLEGLPGLGKTRLVRALAGALDLSFQRIQCTPDLMPADIIGTYVVMETPQGRRTFEFQKGPLFANLVLADQVNRTTPKTQAALLQAMDEDSITLATETFNLPRPYLVIATQNPLEMEGTYPLPEAQIDRFFFKVVVRPPDCDQMEQILARTTGQELVEPRPVVDGARVLEMGKVLRSVAVSDAVRREAVEIVAATQPESPRAPATIRENVRHGSSPRGAQAILLGAKAHAILAGRQEVAGDDLHAVAHAALRHRLILNFRGLADEVSVDRLVDDVLEAVRGKSATAAAS